MTNRLISLILPIVLFLILPDRIVPAAQPGEGDREGLSPYFLVEGDPKVERFPLLKNDVKVNIAGVVAEIELTQVYKNDGRKTIEAVYVFPLGTKSAIHAMTMKIGKRIIEAEIEERMKAQKIYEQAKEKGKVASLLEKKRPNVFQMKVANIMPGDVIEVVVKYTEMLVPEKGIYEWVFPTVVGPRYTGESNPEDIKGKDNWLVSPYLHEGEEVPYEFDININVNSGISLADVWVTSHKVKINKTGNKAQIALAEEEKRRGNRDFVLRYNLEGNVINTGLLLYPDQDEKFFLLMLEPPDKININMVPPREYVFIVDVSGSMHGFPLEVSKALIKKIIIGLRSKDYFNILFFAGSSQVLSDRPLPATEENKRKAIEMLMAQSGGGGTEILDAFKRALALPKKKGLSRIIVTATDGYVSVEKGVFDLMRDNLDQANFFAFGIGTGVNRYLIEGIARIGKGEPFVVTDEKEAEQAAEKFISYIESPLLTDIKVTFEDFDAYEVEPIAMPDLFAERPLILFGKYKNASGEIKVVGRTPRGDYVKKIEVTASCEDNQNRALKYLWARERIARLADYGRVGVDVKEEVTKLGLKYHLMTEYTSFVAVDKVVRETGEIVTVKQPLPLPQGVSDYAVVAGLTMQRALPMATEEITTAGKPDRTKQLAQLYVAGGSVPAGVSLDDIKKAITSQIQSRL
ncbi:MAG: VIT domain-containing protein [candidate division WOR-3 bacterium]